jgi:protein SCO1/2
MNRKALWAVCGVILLPLVSYLLVKYYSDEAVIMPRRFYFDTVKTSIKDGKAVQDTVWHQVENISLTNQLGNQVALSDVKGKIIVADFFFTRCPTICPALTKNMKKIQDALKKNVSKLDDSSFVHFMSFTIDPERDTVEAIKKYADKYGVNPDYWWILTGEKKKIYDFVINEIKLPVEDGGIVDSSFIHTSRFVLLDRDRVVRGYYDGLDSVALNKLTEDLIFIMLEKDKKVKRNLFRK